MEKTFKNILVPTDFSDCANNALKVALNMAERHNAQLHLLHSVEPIYLGRYTNVYGDIVSVQSSFLKDAENNLSKHREEILEYRNIAVKTYTALGNVASLVNDYIDSHSIDIVVMGTHGASGFKEYFAGTNTYDVIKFAHCPVLSVPLAFDQVGFHQVLFPIRAVIGVEEKYEYVKPILDKNELVIHILGISYENDIQERYKVKVDFDRIKSMIEQENRFVTFEEVQSTNIADTVLLIANERKYDLLIINATLDKKWYQFFKGNFTQKIINHCKIPVLAIKPELLPEHFEMANQNSFAELKFYKQLSI